MNLSERYVTFKDEGEDPDGQPIGPVRVIDQDKYFAWQAENGMEPGSFGIPYGSMPDGVEDKGWLRIEDAVQLAKDLGVELRSS